jgi:ubiquinone/menaquinone biosynthesis C-methylase UbiE
MVTKEKLVSKHFAEIADVYKDNYTGLSPTRHLLTTRLTRTYELLGDFHDLEVLDIGCGPGVIASYFVGRGCRYWGVDLVTKMLFEGQSRFKCGEAVFLSTGNMQNLAFPDSSFDLILCLGAIEYAENVQNALHEMERVLKKDGQMVLAVQNRWSPYRLWDRYVYRSDTLNRLRTKVGRPASRLLETSYSLSSIQTCLANEHLEPFDVVYYDFNLWLTPLDRYFPRLSVALSQRLEFLGRSWLQGLGTGYILLAGKTSK